MRSLSLLLAAIFGAIVLAVIATTPPAPLAADVSPTVFSAARAMSDIRQIARAPRPTGSAEQARVRRFLLARLRATGLRADIAAGPLSDAAAEQLAQWRGAAGPRPQVANIVATLPGRDRTLPALLLMAHYDSVWASPGAADDAAGVAAALEVARAIAAAGQPRRDLMILLTDGEELGLDGARLFFARDPRRAHVGLVINLEARGGGGRAAMFETGRGNGALMRLFGAAVHRPSTMSLAVFIYELLPNSTDFTPAKAAGYQGLNFAFIGRPALYHSPMATPAALDRGSVQDMGGQVLDVSRALLAAPTLPEAAPDLTFFDAFGLVLIAYPPAWGWALLALATAGYAFSLRRGGVRLLVRGAAASVALVVLAGGLLFALNLLSGAGEGANYYDRLAAIPRLEVQALLACLAALAALLALVRVPPSEPGLVAGLALPMLALGAAAQALAPTATVPIIVPLLLGGLAAAAGSVAGTRLPAALAAALGGGYLLAFGFAIFQAIGPTTPMVAALPLVLAATLLAPLAPPVGRRAAAISAATLLVPALALALWVRLDPLAPTVPPYSIARGGATAAPG